MLHRQTQPKRSPKPKTTIKAHQNRRISNQLRSKQLLRCKPSPSASPTRKMSSNVHQMSANGFSGESTSAQYDLVRPRYAPEILESLLTPIFTSYSQSPESSHRPLRILDLGCGTGISTKALALYMYEHVSEGCEYEIYAADPNSSMVSVLEKSLTPEALREFDHTTKEMKEGDLKAVLDTIKMPLVASVDELPYKMGFFDGVIACQAFHWFATPRSLLNIQRITHPNGFFAFCWNYWISTNPNLDKSAVPEKDQWLFKLCDLIEPLYIQTNTPQQTNINFRALFTDHTAYEQKYGMAAPFNELYSIYLDPRDKTAVWMNRSFFHQRIDSISVVHTMKDDDKAALFNKIDALLDEPTTPRRINETTGDKEWNVGFFCEVHYAQNSKGGATQ